MTGVPCFGHSAMNRSQLAIYVKLVVRILTSLLLAPLAVLHFFWMRAGKHNFLAVYVYGGVLAALLAWRLVRAARPDIALYGIADPARAAERTPTFAVRVGDEAPAATAHRLTDAGIYAWDGNYYALELMERLGLEGRGGAVRIGFAHYNTLDEVDRVLEAL